MFVHIESRYYVCSAKQRTWQEDSRAEVQLQKDYFSLSFVNSIEILVNECGNTYCSQLHGEKLEEMNLDELIRLERQIEKGQNRLRRAKVFTFYYWFVILLILIHEISVSMSSSSGKLITRVWFPQGEKLRKEIVSLREKVEFELLSGFMIWNLCSWLAVDCVLTC